MTDSLFIATRDIKENIARLMQQELEGRITERPQLDETLSGFLRIKGISRFWSPREYDRGRSLKQSIEDMVTGLYSEGIPFAYLTMGKENGIAVHWGASRIPEDRFLTRFLQGNLPCIELETVNPSLLLKELSILPNCAMMTGSPTPKDEEEDKLGVYGIERLIRALYGERFAYLVLARPLGISTISTTFEVLAEEVREIKNSHLRKGSIEEDNHPLAKYYLDLLEAALDKFKIGRIQGSWEVNTYLFTQSQGILERGRTMLASIFSGDKSLPVPIRFHQCLPPSKGSSRPPITVLNSKDLSLLTQLPKEEFPGYKVLSYSRFAVSPPEVQKEKPVAIGQIMDGTMSTGNWFEVELDDLTKHVLVAGVTGSGKTTFSHFLLDQVWRENRVPFLVIEPSIKTEYRDLRGAEWGEDPRIFTLGDENEAPFRLNPFEIQSGVSVQTHIDYLRVLFQASFAGLYAPMPYILEEALYRVYMDKGWDLATGKNLRGKGLRSFPTLSEFCRTVGEIVNTAGYDKETTQNIGTALKIRLGSLRAGAKGLMLDTRYSINLDELFKKYPTVLELGKIGDDEEKAFLMGLLLIKLFEYFSNRNQNQKTGLQHVVLIEEAHRLLRNTPQETGNIEVSNIRGKAVEAFCNLLAEMRALGVGAVVCDQIPTKLASDVIKNTNLKLLFRMVSDEDRKIVGASMNMSEEQRRAVATFRTGEAAVYAEGVNEPFLVSIPNFREHAINENLIQECDIASHMKKVFYDGHPEFPSTTNNSFLNYHMLEEPEFIEVFNRFFFSVVEGDGVTSSYNELVEIIERHFSLKNSREIADHIYFILSNTADRSFEEKSKLYNLSFIEVDNLVYEFTAIIKAFAEQVREGKEVKVDHEIAALIFAFQSRYKELTRQTVGPYTGCKGCRAICLYRYEVGNFLSDDMINHDWNEALRSKPEDVWEAFARVALSAAKRVVATDNREILKRVAFCFASQMVAYRKYPSLEQERFMRNIEQILDKEGVDKE